LSSRPSSPIRPPLASPLFPYTTLFRSLVAMLVDPAINIMTTGPDPKVMYAYESADPVEQLSFKVDGIAMTDFEAELLDRIGAFVDRKSTRLNSIHVATSIAVFCLKKKN